MSSRHSSFSFSVSTGSPRGLQPPSAICRNPAFGRGGFSVVSHPQLLEIAAAGCEASTEVMKRADALLAAHKPLAPVGGRGSAALERPGAAPAGAAAAGGRRGGFGVLAVGGRLEGHQRGPALPDKSGVRLPSGPARHKLEVLQHGCGTWQRAAGCEVSHHGAHPWSRHEHRQHL